MVFVAADPAMTESVKVGHKIVFHADKVNGQMTVTKIEKRSDGAPIGPRVMRAKGSPNPGGPFVFLHARAVSWKSRNTGSRT